MKKSIALTALLCPSFMLCETTILHDAITNGDLVTVEEVAYQVDINAHEITHGKTALHQAVEHGFMHMVTFLIHAGADVNAESNDPSNPYPLHLAVVSGHLEIVIQLLNAGAQINRAARASGKTALHKAAELGMYAMAKELLTHGADKNIQDNSGKTAYDYAMDNKWHLITNLLA